MKSLHLLVSTLALTLFCCTNGKAAESQDRRIRRVSPEFKAPIYDFDKLFNVNIPKKPTKNVPNSGNLKSSALKAPGPKTRQFKVRAANSPKLKAKEVKAAIKNQAVKTPELKASTRLKVSPAKFIPAVKPSEVKAPKLKAKFVRMTEPEGEVAKKKAVKSAVLKTSVVKAPRFKVKSAKASEAKAKVPKAETTDVRDKLAKWLARFNLPTNDINKKSNNPTKNGPNSGSLKSPALKASGAKTRQFKVRAAKVAKANLVKLPVAKTSVVRRTALKSSVRASASGAPREVLKAPPAKIEKEPKIIMNAPTIMRPSAALTEFFNNLPNKTDMVPAQFVPMLEDGEAKGENGGKLVAPEKKTAKVMAPEENIKGQAPEVEEIVENVQVAPSVPVPATFPKEPKGKAFIVNSPVIQTEVVNATENCTRNKTESGFNGHIHIEVKINVN